MPLVPAVIVRAQALARHSVSNMGAKRQFDKSMANSDKTQQVAPGIWRLPLPMRFNPGHINSYLLEDDGGWTLVDAGNHSEDTRQAWQQALSARLADAPVRRLILTHAHPDHYGSAPWLLERTGAQLCLAGAEWHAVNHLWRGSVARADEMAAFFSGLGVVPEALPAIQQFMQGFAAGCPATEQQPECLEPGSCLVINGQSWRLHGGYGHSPCNLLLERESDGVLITGDQVLPTITPNVSLWFDSDPDPMGLMLDSLARLQRLPVSLALPAHGDPFDDFSARCAVIERTYHRRLDRIRAALQDGAETLADLGQAGFGGAPRGPMYMLVAGQLLALLSCLRERGEVVQSGAAWRLATP